MSGKSIVKGYDCLWDIVHVTVKGLVVLESPTGSIITTPPSKVSTYLGTEKLTHYQIRVDIFSKCRSHEEAISAVRRNLEGGGFFKPRVWMF